MAIPKTCGNTEAAFATGIKKTKEIQPQTVKKQDKPQNNNNQELQTASQELLTKMAPSGQMPGTSRFGPSPMAGHFGRVEDTLGNIDDAQLENMKAELAELNEIETPEIDAPPSLEGEELLDGGVQAISYKGLNITEISVKTFSHNMAEKTYVVARDPERGYVRFLAARDEAGRIGMAEVRGSITRRATKGSLPIEIPALVSGQSDAVEFKDWINKDVAESIGASEIITYFDILDSAEQE